MGKNKDNKKKLAGQREAIKEHIGKYYRYRMNYEKIDALKTIRNAQEQIRKLKRKSKNLDDSPLDNWSPDDGRP